MRRRAHRTALTALVLATGATACLTGCQSGQDDTSSGGTARSAAPAESTSRPAPASPSASTPEEPFAGLTGEEISERAIKATTVDGTPAITLYETDGSERNTLYVATDGKPYLLRFESGSEEEPCSLSLTGYDEPVPAEVPSGEIIDLDAMSA